MTPPRRISDRASRWMRFTIASLALLLASIALGPILPSKPLAIFITILLCVITTVLVIALALTVLVDNARSRRRPILRQ